MEKKEGKMNRSETSKLDDAVYADVSGSRRHRGTGAGPVPLDFHPARPPESSPAGYVFFARLQRAKFPPASCTELVLADVRYSVKSQREKSRILERSTSVVVPRRIECDASDVRYAPKVFLFIRR